MSSADLPRAKGWFSFDRHTITCSTLAVAITALALKYGISSDIKLKSVKHLAVFPVFMAYDKLDDEVYLRTGYRHLSGAFAVAACGAALSWALFELSPKDCLLYGGVCGASVMIADTLATESNSVLAKI